MEANDTLTERESLRIIEETILSAKRNIRENGFLYLLWGWLVFLAGISQYILMEIVRYEAHYITWNILMPLGAVISIIYGIRRRRKSAVKTYTGEFIGYLWTAFCVSLFIVLLSMNRIGVTAAYPMLMLLYGIGTFVSGGALRFRPLVLGGCFCWVLAAISFYMDFSTQLLLLSLSMLGGYIIPGYMLKARSANV